MKTLLRISLTCLAASITHADVVVEQKIESTVLNGLVTTKVKGNLARVEAPTPIGQTISIFDLEKGKMTLLMSGQKMAMQMEIAALVKQAEAALKTGGADAAPAKPVATGAKKKVGAWEAEEYTATAHGVKMRVWVAPLFPKGKEIATELAKVSTAISPGTPDPNSFGLPGLVVQSEIETPVGRITSTLQSAAQTPVAAGEFAAPADYQVMQAPAGLGGPQ